MLTGVLVFIALWFGDITSLIVLMVILQTLNLFDLTYKAAKVVIYVTFVLIFDSGSVVDRWEGFTGSDKVL